MRHRRFAALIAAFALTLPVAADPLPNALATRVKKDLEYLAGDTCEGRGLDTKGILKAGEYIADTFKQAGLKPAFKDGYFQPFEVPAPRALGTPHALTLKNGDRKIEPAAGDGFVATIASGGGKTTHDLVFVGYGVATSDGKYDDYTGVDVKGKVVIVLRRTPKAGDPTGPFADSGPNANAGSLAVKMQAAKDRQAAGILFVNDRTLADQTDPLMKWDQTRDGRLDGPVLHVKRAVIDDLLKAKNTTLEEVEKGIDKEMKPNSFALTGWAAAAEVTVVTRTWPTRNVVAVCDGAGPLADETVVIGAHYDHLGAGEPGSFDTNKGKTHYGADDNGSGTSGLLELARRYGAMKSRQGRRIVFIGFSGEEQGLHGSKHYCKEPPFPLDKTAFMLNMDMIGRCAQVDDGHGGKKDRLVVYGTGTSTALDQLVDEKNKPFDFKLFKIPGGSGPSDHTSFYDKKIPVLFFFTGTHKDYHRPSDTPDKINVDGLLKVAGYVQAFADHFATITERPDFQRTKGGSEDPTDTTPRTQGRVSVPKIKFTPGNYGEEDKGVLVEAVEAGGPAEKGGMKEGDYIVEVAGTPVKNMTGYMQALGKVKAETETEFVVLRKGEKVKLKVVPMK
jgi:hypothetical protein